MTDDELNEFTRIVLRSRNERAQELLRKLLAENARQYQCGYAAAWNTRKLDYQLQIFREAVLQAPAGRDFEKIWLRCGEIVEFLESKEVFSGG